MWVQIRGGPNWAAQHGDEAWEPHPNPPPGCPPPQEPLTHQLSLATCAPRPVWVRCWDRCCSGPDSPNLPSCWVKTGQSTTRELIELLALGHSDAAGDTAQTHSPTGFHRYGPRAPGGVHTAPFALLFSLPHFQFTCIPKCQMRPERGKAPRPPTPPSAIPGLANDMLLENNKDHTTCSRTLAPNVHATVDW